VVGELISKPYIHITLELLARFGIAVKNDSWQRFVIPQAAATSRPAPSMWRPTPPPPATSSRWARLPPAPPMTPMPTTAQPKSIRILGVGQDSIQGDIRFIEAAQAMGAQVESGPNWLQVSRGSWPLKAIDLDCNHIPDAAMTLGVMALYADGVTTLRNIASWRVKETDRIAAMAIELRKLGATVEEGADYIRITPPAGKAAWKAASIHTYDDHRVAMCFSLAAFNPAKLPVRIEDPKCVAKTFPTISRRCSPSAKPSASIFP
jgi:3-phosphoshikimate 1-carboxyvinyltransferase